MKFLSDIGKRLKSIFGIRKNSKYVKNYLNDANMRSAVFMSFVIFVLEVWLVLRQTHKYVIPKFANPGSLNWFEIIFKYTSLYIVMLSFGVAMFVYSLQYLSKKRTVAKLVVPIVFAGLSLAICCLLPLEFKLGSINLIGTKLVMIQGILKLVFYGSIVAFDAGIIFSSIYRYRGGKNQAIGSVMVISLFALVCLTFGVMVSYGDFISSAIYTNVQVGVDKNGNPIIIDVLGNDKSNKQIICFLMFTIYIGCLLIWSPLISIGILGTLFLGFYFALHNVASMGGRILPEGDEVNYITFFISLTMVCISIFNQRISEARKDEELEELATKDKLTGTYSFEYFTMLCKERIEKDNIQQDEWTYLFINITNFKIYNDQKGFEQGNIFLKEVGEILKEEFKDSYISRQSDDHFVIFTKNEDVEYKFRAANIRVKEKDLDVKPGIRAGIFPIYFPAEDPHISVEKARYAYAELKHTRTNNLFAYYDDQMHDNYLMVQYIVNHIDEAIQNHYIKAFYQPVVWSKGRELCGAEALARWIDPKYGFLSPAKFVPALENAQLIHKLDMEIIRIVCEDIRYNLNHNLAVLPVSINFSRADFGLIDIVDVVDKTVTKYNIPKELLHVEITESALMNDEDLLKDTIIRLHQNGYATWLDDFGSGYSSFNVLKDYEFDVLKLDMKFLTGFDGNEKAKSLIKSVIDMADRIGMKTLCEGVETMEQAEFLESASCGRLQGYLYGKPLSYDDLMAKINAGEYQLSDDIIFSAPKAKPKKKTK